MYLLTNKCQRVIDADTYIFNMTAANLKGETERPEYFKLYNHRQDLDMENLFPEDFDKLARRLAVDDALYDNFYRYDKNFYSKSFPDKYG